MFERIKNFINKIFNKKSWWVLFFLFCLISLPFLNTFIVDAGFPTKYFGWRYEMDVTTQTFKNIQAFGKFQYNGTYSARPDNITFDVSIVATGVNPCKVAMSIYDNSGNIRAWTTHTTYTSSTSGRTKFAINYTANDTVLTKNSYYYIGIWASLGGTIPSANVYIDDSWGQQLGTFSRADTGYFAWDNGISFTTVDADATMCCFVNYTEITNPAPPTNLNAQSIYGNDDCIDLSWTKGLYALKTRIMMKENTNPTTISDGTLVYNNTGSSYQVCSLDDGKYYCFSAWSWNTTFGTYSLTYVSDCAWCYKRPVKPSDFIGNNVSYTRNLFAWTKGTNATVTRIQYNVNTSYPTTVSTGTNTYNSTNTYNDDSGLLKNSSYYYSAWSFNSTNGLWSSDYATLKINTNDTIYGGGDCDNTSLTIYNNTAHTTGKYQSSYNALTGWKIWLNYTGVLPVFNHYENIVDATGTHQHNSADSGYIINSWANYTGNLTDIHIINNTVDVTGKYEQKQNITGYWIFLNYTGVGGECPNQYLIYLYENIINTSGTHEYVLNETGYIVYANYTGNTNISEGNITEDDLNISVFSVITFGGIGVLIIRRRKRNES